MKYRMIALDMDDTLLNDNIKISKENIKAIKKAKEKGTIITICSGRASKSIENLVKDIDFISPNDYFISYNGAVITDFNGNNIFYKPIQGQILKDLIHIGREFGVDVQLYYNNKIIVSEYTDRVKLYEQMNTFPVTIEKDLEKYNESVKVLFNYDDVEKLEKLRLYILQLYSDKVNVFFSKPTYLEVLSKEANKGVALKYLSNHININRDEIIAVGDSFNDTYMIEYAGMGVAMNNAHTEIKKIANYVTKYDNNENGVSEVIEKFILTKFQDEA